MDLSLKAFKSSRGKKNPVDGMDPVDLEVAARKTIWNDQGEPWSFICPLCEADRRVRFNPHPANFKYIAKVALTSLIFMFAAWPWFHWKGLVVFVPLWAVFEFTYRWRMRAAIICPHCGFDPYLFSIDMDWAKEEIEAHWRKKFEEKNIPYPDPKNKGKVSSSQTLGQGAGKPENELDSGISET